MVSDLWNAWRCARSCATVLAGSFLHPELLCSHTSDTFYHAVSNGYTGIKEDQERRNLKTPFLQIFHKGLSELVNNWNMLYMIVLHLVDQPGVQDNPHV